VPWACLAISTSQAVCSSERQRIQQPHETGQAAGRAAVDPLPFLLGVGIKQEVLTIGQHPLGCQGLLDEQEGTAVGAEGSGGPIQQVAIVFCGTQLDAAGLGRPVTMRLGACQDNNRPQGSVIVRRPS
jgi:hypothetical protein